jgi:hypothetical protein
MSQHHSKFKSGSGVAIYLSFKQHGWASLKMILIATYEVVDRRHLEMYETLWMNKLKAVNKTASFSLYGLLKVGCDCGSIIKLTSLERHTSLYSHSCMINRRRSMARKLAAEQETAARKAAWRAPVKQPRAATRAPCPCGGSFLIKADRHFLSAHQTSKMHKEWIEKDPNTRSYMPEAIKAADELMEKLFK